MTFADAVDPPPLVKTPEGAYTWRIGRREFLESSLSPIDASARIDEVLAAQVAIADLVIPLVFHSVSLEHLIKRNENVSEKFGGPDKPIHFDFPEPTTETTTTTPQLCVYMQGGELSYADPGLGGSRFLERTADRYGSGTVVMHERDASGTFTITTTLNTKDERRAVRRGLNEVFLREFGDVIPGRRIIAPYYYDTMIRITPQENAVVYDDSDVDVAAERWMLHYNVLVEVPVLRLVSEIPRLRYINPPIIEILAGEFPQPDGANVVDG